MKPFVAWARRALFDAEIRRGGAQIAAAVVLAYCVSWAAGLPEQLWAVMSALLVMRSNAASTFDAGLDRVRSTLLGALCGLLGVCAANLGVGAAASTLVVVAALGYLSAAAPSTRGAPVAALIVLSSAALAGHGAPQAAALRVVQILLGVGVALAVSWTSAGYRAGDRLRAGCSRVLRGAAARVAQSLAQAAAGDGEAEPATEAARRAIDRLTALAHSADKAARFLRGATLAATDDRRHRRLAGLTGRALQDAAMFNRLLRVAAPRGDEGGWRAAAEVASAALAHAADVIEGLAEPELSQLRRFLHGHVPSAGDDEPSAGVPALFAAPLHLLLEDLNRLCRCATRAPSDRSRGRRLAATTD